MTIRTRFAPSPTGYLHVGGLRTLLNNYYFARQNHGDLLLRIEDTDRERLVPGAIEALVKTLELLGIDYDEGPVIADGVLKEKGDHGPYTQSSRLPLYREHAEKLLASGHAYRCFCSKERLDEVRKQGELAKQPAKYDRCCLKLSTEEVATRVASGDAHVIRLKVPEGETTFTDIIHGKITVPNADVDDQVLMKSDGFPTYHLAAVVDDHLMEISHVLRAEEWLPSTPKHLMLYAAFGWTAPSFAHLPQVLNADRTKLSKRQGDVAVEDYLKKGYLPEALENFLSLIGYNPTGDREIYSREEMVKLFDLSKVNKAGGFFDVTKLNWMNEQYLRKLSVEELMESVKPFLAVANREVPAEMLKKICAVEQGRLTTLKEMVERVEGYLAMPAYDPSILVWKKADVADAKRNLEIIIAFLEAESASLFDTIALLEARILGYIKEKELKNGNVLWPMRVALSGRSASPSPFELAWVLGKDETLRRLAAATKFF